MSRKNNKYAASNIILIYAAIILSCNHKLNEIYFEEIERKKNKKRKKKQNKKEKKIKRKSKIKYYTMTFTLCKAPCKIIFSMLILPANNFL